MGLEERNGRLYYYRKERHGNRVRSVYVGSGSLARWAADLAEEECVFTEMKRQRLASIREKGREISEACGTLDRYIRLHVSASLVLEGYRSHKRQWRQRRYPLPIVTMPKKRKATVPAGSVSMSITFDRGNSIGMQINGTADDTDIQAARELMDRCSGADPDVTDLVKLRAWMERDGVMIRAEELARAVWLKAVSGYMNASAEEAALAGVEDLVLRMRYAQADATE